MYVYSTYVCAIMATMICNVSLMCTASSNQATSLTAAQDVALFVVKFDYNPFEMSPNPNPYQELSLTAGRYLYIYGDMDEVMSYSLRILHISNYLACVFYALSHKFSLWVLPDREL